MDAGAELRGLLLLLLKSIVPTIVGVVGLEILEDSRLHRLADVVHHGRAAFEDAPHPMMRCGHPRQRGRLVDHPGREGTAAQSTDQNTMATKCAKGSELGSEPIEQRL